MRDKSRVRMKFPESEVRAFSFIASELAQIVPKEIKPVLYSYKSPHSLLVMTRPDGITPHSLIPYNKHGNKKEMLQMKFDAGIHVITASKMWAATCLALCNLTPCDGLPA